MPNVCRSQRGIVYYARCLSESEGDFVICHMFVGVKGGFCDMPYVCRSQRGIV